jgi:hypothetical protein
MRPREETAKRASPSGIYFTQMTRIKFASFFGRKTLIFTPPSIPSIHSIISSIVILGRSYTKPKGSLAGEWSNDLVKRSSYRRAVLIKCVCSVHLSGSRTHRSLHQVSNSADCIKVAVDFVSTENVHRCFKLTKEFRELNLAKAWKDDVLQLRNMLWFAWLSCQRLSS